MNESQTLYVNPELEYMWNLIHLMHLRIIHNTDFFDLNHNEVG